MSIHTLEEPAEDDLPLPVNLAHPVVAYRCKDCGLEITDHDIFDPQAILHTCSVCERHYRNSHPFSSLRYRNYLESRDEKVCSAACLDRAKERTRHEEILRSIPVLEGMARNAAEEVYRKRALAALREFATDPDAIEAVKVSARTALKRLGHDERTELR